MPLLNGRTTSLTTAANRPTGSLLNLQRNAPTPGDTSLRASESSSLIAPDPRQGRGEAGFNGTSQTRSFTTLNDLGMSSAALHATQTECGNPDCKGGWTPPWRSRRYPFFEGRWSCSQRCRLAMVKAAVAREMGDSTLDAMDATSDGAVQHRHRVPLGLVMLAQGWITHPQLRKALEMQRLKGKGRIGDWLISECGLKAEWITRGLSVQWNCPVLTTEGFSPETMARAVPRVFIEEYGILPVRVAGRRILYVGFQDQIDASSAFAVERISGLRTECGVVGEDRYQKAKDLVLACRFVDLRRSVVGDRDHLARSIERIVDQSKPTSARLVRLHKHYWLRLWQEDERHARPFPQIPAAGEAADYLFTIGN